MRTPRTTEHPPRNRLALYQEPGNVHLWNLSLPLGFTCPHARSCKTFVSPGLPFPLQDKGASYLCAFATEELNLKTNKVVWHNLRTLLGNPMQEIIKSSLEMVPDGDIVRLHQWGDFFSKDYLTTWFQVMRETPRLFFDVCTKALDWLNDEIAANGPPMNATIIISSGGTHDSLIPALMELGCKARHVLFTEKAIAEANIPVLPDLHGQSPLDEAAFVVEGLQMTQTAAGDLARNLGSGDTFAFPRFKPLSARNNLTR